MFILLGRYLRTGLNHEIQVINLLTELLIQGFHYLVQLFAARDCREAHLGLRCQLLETLTDLLLLGQVLQVLA